MIKNPAAVKMAKLSWKNRNTKEAKSAHGKMMVEAREARKRVSHSDTLEKEII